MYNDEPFLNAALLISVRITPTVTHPLDLGQLTAETGIILQALRSDTAAHKPQTGTNID